MTAKISEIFQSIQGEGKYLGAKQVFVRFYGCNIHCSWCDTPYAIGDVPGRFETFNLPEVIQKTKTLYPGCHSVSLTGGEPLMQKDFLKEFLPALKKDGITTYLETSGILPRELKEVIDHVDIVAMDMKLPSSTKCRDYWNEHEEFLKIASRKDVFIKTVITSDTSQEDLDRAVRLVSQFNRNILFVLQPNFIEIKNGAMVKCLEFQDRCKKQLTDVRVLPQIHKFMKWR